MLSRQDPELTKNLDHLKMNALKEESLKIFIIVEKIHIARLS